VGRDSPEGSKPLGALKERAGGGGISAPPAVPPYVAEAFAGPSVRASGAGRDIPGAIET
jgi:hypothetical protein